MHALVAKIQPHKFVQWFADGDFFATFLRPEFQASCVQHISYLHSKFALRPNHVYTNMVDIHPAAAEIRRGEKKKKNERNHRAKI